MSKLSIVLLLLCSSLGGAQESSNLMPAPPPASKGGSGPNLYVPGMPAPQPSRSEVAPAAEEKKVRAGYVVPEPRQGIEAGDEQAEVEGPVPETHLVVEGDTLWNLAATYLHSAWAWPKLWALNPSITNPHWIYPGDVIRLRSGSGESAVASSTNSGESREAPALRQGSIKTEETIALSQNGFVEPKELEVAGKIVGSKIEKKMLSTGDEAYVEFKKSAPLQVGERYTVYETIGRVKHPVSRKRLGDLVKICGEIRVQSITEGGIAKVTVLEVNDVIERGLRVGPLRRHFKRVAPKASKIDAVGVVVARLDPLKMVDTFAVVFIDRGKSDGVEVGTRFAIVRRGDGYQAVRSEPQDDKRFPRESIGELVIVDLREHLSAGIVTGVEKEAAIGDRVETHAGW